MVRTPGVIVGDGVGRGVAEGVGTAEGVGVAEGVGAGVGVGVAEGVGVGVGGAGGGVTTFASVLNVNTAPVIMLPD